MYSFSLFHIPCVWTFFYLKSIQTIKRTNFLHFTTCGSWQEILSILSIVWSSKISRNLVIFDEIIISKEVHNKKLVKRPLTMAHHLRSLSNWGWHLILFFTYSVSQNSLYIFNTKKENVIILSQYRSKYCTNLGLYWP